VLLFRRGLRAEAIYVAGTVIFVLETWGARAVTAVHPGLS
jgi:hypothetical protein